MSLFSVKQDSASKIHVIEINDEKIDNEIVSFICELEKELNKFKSFLQSSPDSTRKDEELMKIREMLTMIHQKVNQLKVDVEKIFNLELVQKQYIIIKDEQYLKDKQYQISELLKHLESVLSALDAKPNMSDLRNDLIHGIIQDINRSVDCLNKIIADDQKLELIYRGLDQL